MYLRMFLNQLWMGLKLISRVPSAIFWLFAFPAVMLLGLGTVFSGAGTEGPKLVWSHTAGSSQADDFLQQALTERGVRLEILPPAEAEARWQSGKLATLLEGDDGHYSLRVNNYLLMQAMQTEALVQQAYLTAQARAQGASDLVRVPVMKASPGGHHDGPYAGFLLPGLIGLNVLMMGIFGTGMTDVTMRDKGGYKRLATTPLPRAIFIGAQVTVRLFTVILSAAMLMIVGALVFGVSSQGAYGAILLLIILGGLCFASLGYLLGSFARTVESYSGLANLAFLPLMLLSGVYFSLDAAPAWLQKGADLLPLAPLLKALRAVFNDGATLVSQGPALAVMAGWTVVLFGAAVKRFRWI
jgi:ABC-type multidrug transport system permease subunit